MNGEAKRTKEEVLKLNQELSILNAISQVVNESTDLEEILNKSVDKIMEMIDVHQASIYFLDENTNELALVVQRGFSKKFLESMKRRKLGEGLAGKVALSGESIFVEDYPKHLLALSSAIEEGLRAAAVVPLKSREKIYGTLNIFWKGGYKIAPFEKSLFNSIGQIISGSLERTFLYTENVKRLEELKTLYSISQEIASKLELKAILQKIVENAVGLMGAEEGTISLWDNRRQNYSPSHLLEEKLLRLEAV
jgi:GAF domain-containing protein